MYSQFNLTEQIIFGINFNPFKFKINLILLVQFHENKIQKTLTCGANNNKLLFIYGQQIWSQKPILHDLDELTGKSIASVPETEVSYFTYKKTIIVSVCGFVKLLVLTAQGCDEWLKVVQITDRCWATLNVVCHWLLKQIVFFFINSFKQGLDF